MWYAYWQRSLFKNYETCCERYYFKYYTRAISRNNGIINNAPISGEERPVSEALDNTIDEDENNLTAKVETSTSLLTALNSEKEAVVTYEMLLSLTTDEEEIELLTRILNDEKEHIALLSSLQTKQVADYVAEDNKEMLDNNAQDVIDAPAMTD